MQSALLIHSLPPLIRKSEDLMSRQARVRETEKFTVAKNTNSGSHKVLQRVLVAAIMLLYDVI